MKTLVIADPIHPAGVEALKPHFNVQQFSYSDTASDKAAIVAALQNADYALVRAIPVTREVLEASPRLKLVARHGAGTDNIDVQAASELGIAVTNCGDANAVAVAEAAVCLMLATLRRIPQMHAVVVNETFADNWFINRWSSGFGGLSGKCLGLVGMGNIGSNVGRMCAGGFNMRVLAYDPGLSAEDIAARGGEKVESLDELMALADVVSVHAPRMPQTRHMVGAAQIACMKSDAILVHTSRGGVVDEAALVAALRERRIGGAGVDVYEVEPPRKGNPLFELDNVVLTPHVGAGTDESHRRVALEIASIITRFANGEQPATMLNKQIWDRRRL